MHVRVSPVMGNGQPVPVLDVCRFSGLLVLSWSTRACSQPSVLCPRAAVLVPSNHQMCVERVSLCPQGWSRARGFPGLKCVHGHGCMYEFIVEGADRTSNRSSHLGSVILPAIVRCLQNSAELVVGTIIWTSYTMLILPVGKICFSLVLQCASQASLKVFPWALLTSFSLRKVLVCSLCVLVLLVQSLCLLHLSRRGVRLPKLTGFAPCLVGWFLLRGVVSTAVNSLCLVEKFLLTCMPMAWWSHH